jgi:hypothetical protein
MNWHLGNINHEQINDMLALHKFEVAKHAMDGRARFWPFYYRPKSRGQGVPRPTIN